MTDFRHTSVLAREVVAHAPQAGVFADLTLGGGGHAAAILSARPGITRYIGLDRDPVAFKAATSRVQDQRLHAVQSRFSNLPGVLDGARVDGLLADLGVSSPQLDDADRGFSFMREGPLDMRMGDGPTLKDYLQAVAEDELRRVIGTYGEERFAGRVAHAIIAHRDSLSTTTELAKVVRAVIPHTDQRIDSATRTFQALRIAVNDELGELDRLLAVLPDVLADDGVAMIISFHSLEDRAVKDVFRAQAQGCICPPKLPVCACGRKPVMRMITKKPIIAQPDEVAANPRSRSAKLRVARRNPRAA